MTLRHKVRLMPARVRWFFGDLKGAVLYYRKYKGLQSFVSELEEEYLLADKDASTEKEDLIEMKAKYEMAKTILNGRY